MFERGSISSGLRALDDVAFFKWNSFDWRSHWLRNCTLKWSWKPKIWMPLGYGKIARRFFSTVSGTFIGRNWSQVELAIGALTAGVKECRLKGTLVVRLESELHLPTVATWTDLTLETTTEDPLLDHSPILGGNLATKRWELASNWIWKAMKTSLSQAWWFIS